MKHRRKKIEVRVINRPTREELLRKEPSRYDVLKYNSFKEYADTIKQSKLKQSERNFLDKFIKKKASRKQMFEIPITRLPMLLNSLYSRTPKLGREPYKRLLAFAETLFELTKEYEERYARHRGYFGRVNESKKPVKHRENLAPKKPSRLKTLKEDLTGMSTK